MTRTLIVRPKTPQIVYEAAQRHTKVHVIIDLATDPTPFGYPYVPKNVEHHVAPWPMEKDNPFWEFYGPFDEIIV